MMSRVRRSVFCAVVFASMFIASPSAFAEEGTSAGSPTSLQAQALIEAIQLGTTGAPGTFVAPTFTTSGELRQAAQDDPRHEGVGIGFKIGPLWSKLSQSGIPNVPDFGNKSGYMLGIFFGGNRPGVIGVMGELMYAKKTVATTNFTAGDTNLQYLEIPILLRVNAGTNSLSGILGYFIVGPVFDIRLSASLKESGFDVKDSYDGFDIGVIVGGGVEITRFIVELRGNWGLRNIQGGDLTTAQEIKTKSVALLFGIRFN